MKLRRTSDGQRPAEQADPVEVESGEIEGEPDQHQGGDRGERTDRYDAAQDLRRARRIDAPPTVTVAAALPGR